MQWMVVEKYWGAIGLWMKTLDKAYKNKEPRGAMSQTLRLHQRRIVYYRVFAFLVLMGISRVMVAFDRPYIGRHMVLQGPASTVPTTRSLYDL
jgi:hypothetical protein